MKEISPHLIKVVTTLNDLQYHDGNELGLQCQLSRSAVWKIINKLIHYQVPVKATKKLGYLLQEPLVLLEKDKILGLLSTEMRKKIELIVLESVGSTNDMVKLPSTAAFSFCLAEKQTTGRGRFNRTWSSPFGQNIYFSCRSSFYKDVSQLSGLSLIVGLVVLHVLSSFCGVWSGLSLKWPNDVFYQDKKIAGILVEVSAETNSVCQVIIGIGLNVNQTQNPDIQKGWDSLQKITQQYWDRNAISAQLIIQLLNALEIFSRQNLAPFLPQLEEYDYLKGKNILLTSGNEEITGISMGINPQGHLLLKLPEGHVMSLSSGDVSVLSYQ